MKKKFVSPLARDIEEFIAFKRALGRTYQREEFRLRSLDRLAADYAAGEDDFCLKLVIKRWLSRKDGRKPETVSMEYSVARQFCLFLRRRDPQSFVPDRDIAPVTRKSRFIPYVFSLDEIRQLLRAMQTLRGSSFRKSTFRMLLLVLYCTGLRFGEAVRLTLRDADLRGRTFFITNSKGKSRWVPFRDDLAQELRNYLRDRLTINPASGGSRFFVKLNGREYSVTEASNVIRLLLRRLGLKPPSGRLGPRPYDVRHSFAVHRLSRWYDDGVDIQAHLPWLSAYMGHDNLLGTETYLSATPELLRLASQRFAARLHQTEEET